MIETLKMIFVTAVLAAEFIHPTQSVNGMMVGVGAMCIFDLIKGV